MGLEVTMANVVVCAEPGSLQTAGRFAAKLLGGADLRSFEDLQREIPMQPVLVYITHPNYDHLRSFLEFLKPTGGPDVVIYYANRVAPADAARLGKLIGETRPRHTSLVFEAKAAAQSVLQYSKSAPPRNVIATSGAGTRLLREHFGLTQTELAHATGVSLRTVQNWEKAGAAGKTRPLRDLEELWTILRESMKRSDIPAWLRSPNDAFSGQSPIDLLKDGKTRDIIIEFRRLQAGEPA
jgi:DNA-binding transcriptional regulator YiaG